MINHFKYEGVFEGGDGQRGQSGQFNVRSIIDGIILVKFCHNI